MAPTTWSRERWRSSEIFSMGCQCPVPGSYWTFSVRTRRGYFGGGLIPSKRSARMPHGQCLSSEDLFHPHYSRSASRWADRVPHGQREPLYLREARVLRAHVHRILRRRRQPRRPIVEPLEGVSGAASAGCQWERLTPETRPGHHRDGRTENRRIVSVWDRGPMNVTGEDPSPSRPPRIGIRGRRV